MQLEKKFANKKCNVLLSKVCHFYSFEHNKKKKKITMLLQSKSIRQRFPKMLDNDVQAFDPSLHMQNTGLQSCICAFHFISICIQAHMQISLCINMSQTCVGLTDTVAILSEIFQLTQCVYQQNNLPLLSKICTREYLS